MKETQQNKPKNEIQKIASAPPEKRKSFLSQTEISVVLGLLYAGLVVLLTMMVDLIPVPSKDSTLWMIMAGFYILLIVVSIALERFLLQPLQIKRILFYAVAQIAILIGIIVLIVIGVSNSKEAYYSSKELSYAMAFGFSEIILLLYHLFRAVILSLLHSSKEKQKGKSK